MSWLIVGILRSGSNSGLAPLLTFHDGACAPSEHFKTGLAPLWPKTGFHPPKTRRRKTNSHHPRNGAEERLALQRTTMRSRSCTRLTDFSKSETAFELPSSRRHAMSDEPRKRQKATTFNGLYGDPAGRSDWRSSPPVKSGRYVSA